MRNSRTDLKKLIATLCIGTLSLTVFAGTGPQDVSSHDGKLSSTAKPYGDVHGKGGGKPELIAVTVGSTANIAKKQAHRTEIRRLAEKPAYSKDIRYNAWVSKDVDSDSPTAVNK